MLLLGLVLWLIKMGICWLVSGFNELLEGFLVQRFNVFEIKFLVLLCSTTIIVVWRTRRMTAHDDYFRVTIAVTLTSPTRA